MYDWVTLLYSRNWHSNVNQLYFNTKILVYKACHEGSSLWGSQKNYTYESRGVFKNAIEYYSSACMLSPSFPSNKYDQALSLLRHDPILFGGRWEQGKSWEHEVETVFITRHSRILHSICLCAGVSTESPEQREMVSAFDRDPPIYMSPTPRCTTGLQFIISLISGDRA